MISIVIADDHTVVRHGLRLVLSAEDDFRVVGEAADGLQAARQAARLKPDVLILDVMLPGLNGLDAMHQVAKGSSQTRILVLSMHALDAYVSQALRNGALGYVLKTADSGKLVHAVREVAAGRRYLSPPLSFAAIADYAARTAGTADGYERLTRREREVLHLAADGHSTQQIAARLRIGVRTVETHRANLMRKLGLRSQTDLVRFAVRRGLVTP